MGGQVGPLWSWASGGQTSTMWGLGCFRTFSSGLRAHAIRMAGQLLGDLLRRGCWPRRWRALRSGRASLCGSASGLPQIVPQRLLPSSSRPARPRTVTVPLRSFEFEPRQLPRSLPGRALTGSLPQRACPPSRSEEALNDSIEEAIPKHIGGWLQWAHLPSDPPLLPSDSAGGASQRCCLFWGAGRERPPI